MFSGLIPLAIQVLFGSFSDLDISGKCTKAAHKLKTSSQDASLSLTAQELQLMRKVYKKRFADTQIYKVTGKLSHYFNPRSGKSFHHMDYLRVETAYEPFSTKSIDAGLFDDGSEAYVELEGIMHKDRFYVVNFNNFNVIKELSTRYDLPRAFSASIDSDYKVVSGTLWMMAICLGFEFIPIFLLDAGRSWWFPSMLVVIALFFQGIYIREAYYSKYQHIVQGEFKPRKDIYSNCYQSGSVGTLGGVLVYSPYPLIAGETYQASAQSEQFFLPPFAGLAIDKVNGFSYHYYRHDKTRFSKTVLFLALMTLFSITSGAYIVLTASNYLRDNALYQHNVDKFGENWSHFYRRYEYTGFDYIEVGDYISIADKVSNYDYFEMSRFCKGKKHDNIDKEGVKNYVLDNLFYSYFQSEYEGYKLVVDSDQVHNLDAVLTDDFLDNLCLTYTFSSYDTFTQFIYGPDHDVDGIIGPQGTVVDINREQKIIYLDGHDLARRYNDNSSRFLFAILFFVMILIRVALLLLQLRNMRFLTKKEKNNDTNWI